MNLEELKKISLTDHDIFKILNKKARILNYTELTRFNNINDVLYPNNCFILLYMTKKNYGHWCCCLKFNDRIEFFDPYATLPDDNLKKINPLVKRELREDYPHLVKLLANSKYPIEYNHFRFQQKKKDINTCGRHCAVRCLYKNLKLSQYINFMRKLKKYYGIGYDDLVSIITSN